MDDNSGSITNGKIKATITKLGKLIITNSHGKTLLEEYTRNRRDLLDPKCSALEVEGREFKPITGGDYHVTLRLESVDPDEKIFGMGQYQQPYLDLKGLDIELAHRNSQASVPFALSSLGYGFLWNNPAVGRAVLGKNIMSFEAFSTDVLDYWVVAGDSPAEIEEAYASVTGTVPMMPEYVDSLVEILLDPEYPMSSFRAGIFLLISRLIDTASDFGNANSATRHKRNSSMSRANIRSANCPLI
jgi:alpha-D-xyloside xylohydrolase